MEKEALWERVTTNLETLPVVVEKQCFLDSLSETIRDDQVVCFLEYQRISDNNGKIVGSAALVSIVDPEYFIETMKFLSEITGKESYVDLRNRTWQEIKLSSRAASNDKPATAKTCETCCFKDEPWAYWHKCKVCTCNPESVQPVGDKYRPLEEKWKHFDPR